MDRMSRRVLRSTPGRLGDKVSPGDPRSMSNAENWALYALAKYVEATLDGAYPFRPLLDKDFPEAQKIIKTIADNGLSGFWATEAFSKAGVLSQLHYNATRYQYLSNSSTFFTFNSSFSAYAVADLTTAYFARYDTAYNTSINNFLDSIRISPVTGSGTTNSRNRSHASTRQISRYCSSMTL
jgi:hypothetical protein